MAILCTFNFSLAAYFLIVNVIKKSTKNKGKKKSWICIKLEIYKGLLEKMKKSFYKNN
jgi:hypothetical protein